MVSLNAETSLHIAGNKTQRLRTLPVVGKIIYAATEGSHYSIAPRI